METSIKKIRFADLRWPEIEEVLKESHVVILPAGSTEQHGRHIPVNNDADTSTYLSEQVARRVTDEHGIRVLVAPTIPYAESGGIPPFRKLLPGTIGISLETATRLYYEVVRSLVSQGFKNILILNAHGENGVSIVAALRKVYLEFPSAGLFALDWFRVAWDYWLSIRKGGKEGVGHACEQETAIGLAIGEDVQLDAAVKGYRSESLLSKYTSPIPSLGGTLYFNSRIGGARNSGVMGDPTAATKENGEKIIAVVVDRLTDIVVDIVKSEGMTFEEKL